MRITTTYAYVNHNPILCDCDRHYCDSHRLLWRGCESDNPDCPRCNSEWDTHHEIELQKKDQLRRSQWN